MTYRFTLEAQTQLRAIDRSNAMRILEALHRFGESGSGDVTALHGEWQGCHRLRVGHYRAIFRHINEGIEILTVGHRGDVYRRR